MWAGISKDCKFFEHIKMYRNPVIFQTAIHCTVHKISVRQTLFVFPLTAFSLKLLKGKKV